MARLIASHDWASSPLGAIEGWPQSLQTATAMMLRSRVPMVMLVGRGRHHDLQRRLFGICRCAASSAAWQPRSRGLGRGRGLQRQRDACRPRRRHAALQGTRSWRSTAAAGSSRPGWISIIRRVLDESGRPAGVLAIVVETTERVAAERATAQSESRLRAYLTASSNVMLPHKCGLVRDIRARRSRLHCRSRARVLRLDAHLYRPGRSAAGCARRSTVRSARRACSSSSIACAASTAVSAGRSPRAVPVLG